MFPITIPMNRQSSISAFYFFYLLFLLHICTAFLTIINAFNHDLNDREEIIQLSMDSIHIVKSTESQMLNIEENTNDNEEQELLLALVTSFDEEFPINKPIDHNLPMINSSLSIRFIPPLLHFTEQSIAIPQMQTVIIINEDSEPLEISSLIGTTNEFYPSVLKENILLSYGENISINIYYLPRTIGLLETIFTLRTNRGDFAYDISGIGKENPYRLRPLINIELPINATFEYTIQFYNPYNYSININEIYTSDENLIIEFLSNKHLKNRLTKISPYHEQWYLKPYETKSIIKINYFAYKLNQLYGFICMKTNFNEKIILPVEMSVLNRSGLYSNIDLLEFSPERFIRSVIKSIKIPVYVFNYGADSVTITDVRVTPEHQNYITIRYKNLQIPPDIHRLNQIADITIHPDLIPDDIEHIHGYVEVYTSMDNENPVLKIPFDERVLHGSLDFKKEETYFFMLNNEQNEQCQSIQVFNRYDTPISVYNITVNKIELLSKYIHIKYPSSFFYLYPNQWNELLCITLKKPLLFVSFNNIQAVIDVYTNLSYFNFPIYLYNGFLDLNLLSDHTNGGIRRSETDPFELLITSIPVNTSRIVTFVLTNSNPIDIEISEFEFTLLNCDIQLEYMELLDGNKTKIKVQNTDISQLVIPKQHQAIFSLTINGTNPSEFYNKSITFTTRYQILHINIKYEIIDGSLEFVNKTPLHIDVFPNRPGTIDIYLLNKFDESVNITRINFIAYGLCFSFTWANTSIDRVILQPNKIQKIGKLNFDMVPLCKSVHIPSESTCYCGLNHHPEFKKQWDEYISVLNTFELDHILVNKFRNLWKEWMALIRKQQIQTNIWLYTNRANISWPVTIGFIRPSVLEQSSSILDFEVTYINITKTENVVITNPSSDLLSYSVELLKDYSNKSESLFNDRIFTISSTSKQIELKNNIYHFNLLPDEQITFTISYRPTSPIKHEIYFIIRNNLTILESILLHGEGGIGGLQVGNRQINSPMIPLVIEINENQYKLCSNLDGNPTLRKTVTLQNTGNMETIIYDISFGHSKCAGQGFSVPVCYIELEPNEKYDLKILFQPDYSTDEINETLILNTNIGLITFPIVVHIPQTILSACYKTIPRPPWEFRPYCLCLCLLILIIVFIIISAVFSAKQSFDNYLIRAEWRDRIQTTNNKIFDLKDLSSAIQDEQKPREQIEPIEIIDIKKDKINETKHRRSINSNRISDESNTNIRSVAENPKEIPRKLRRATTDNGPPKASKHQIEIPIKPQPLRREKSEQNTSPISPKPLSSSTVSEEENEPFVPARPKRIVSKRKGSITNTPPKPTPDNTLLLTRQFSLNSNQNDLPQLDESMNDQKWHMVSFNKGQRKGTTTSRREITDEPQIMNKPIKVTSTDSENPVILTPSTHAHSSVSDESKHSRHHRLTQNPSPTSVVPKRNSSQNKPSLVNTNRELAFRQLTEQLWAAGLPSSTTGCSMSIRSRCSSAPPSERGGGGDETTKIDANNYDNKEENIDWDEPDIPDDDFGRYASQTEYPMDESEQKPTINNIPSLMSLPIIPPPIITTNIQQKPTIPPSVIKENIEPLPFPQHPPGPIQRPTKLPCSSTTQLSSFLQDSTQSPNTPDVLVQINHLVDRQNSITTVPSNVPWTPFSTPEWASKYDSTWPLTNIQSPNIPLTTQMQNPFAPRQISKEESTLWSSGLEPTTPWLKFPSVSDASSSNRPENEANNPFWNPINLNESQQNSSTPWWPKTPSDENNNDHDQSRWDFAR